MTTEGSRRSARSAKLDGTERGAGVTTGDGATGAVCARADEAMRPMEMARLAVNLVMIAR
ncbi:hypothetical protein GWA01_17370 [Gluconobacter wancherniae NBRC 103581]|uniref:Uncharacterized protein n=1 Tax=Gluconobacter wancherniae NBRC 103581 TaxID=656744 RepID=A0A511B815_9PROT|nr:hypothetical protein GWA01_17370 [Gluconobacter wancherniae NBRC 103581]